MARKPVGTYARPTGDWFPAKCASVGAAYAPSSDDGVVLALYNDSTAGEYLYVYQLWVNNDGNDDYEVSNVQGVSGSLVCQGFPLVAGNAAPRGQLWVNLIGPVGAPVFDAAIPGAYVGNNVDAEQEYFTANGPLAVLPPGFSMQVLQNNYTMLAKAVVLTVSFWYAVLSDIPSN